MVIVRILVIYVGGYMYSNYIIWYKELIDKKDDFLLNIRRLFIWFLFFDGFVCLFE